MKLITLLENTTCDPALHCAHGLSLYLETPRHRILFDMGPNADFAENAKTLGVDLGAVDVAVLSHGHYDHGGGLQTFFEENSRAEALIHQDAFGDYYAAVPGEEPRYIGLDSALWAYESRIVPTGELVRLDEELTLFSTVPDTFVNAFAGSKLKEKVGEEYRPDRFAHEQNLLITAGGKAVLIAGCAHRGIVNIVSGAEAILGRRPDVVVAGFHLFELPEGSAEADALIAATGKALLEGNTVYYTGHCTGEYAFEKLHNCLGDRLRRITGGGTFTL